MADQDLTMTERPSADLVEMDRVPDDGQARFPPYDRWPLRPRQHARSRHQAGAKGRARKKAAG